MLLKSLCVFRKCSSTTVVDRGFRREPGASAPGKTANFEGLQGRAFAPFLRQEASTAVVLVPVRAVGVVAALSLPALLVPIIMGFTVVVIVVLVVVVCALLLLPVVLITLAVAESVVLILGIVGMLGLRVVVVLSLVLCSRGGSWQREQRRGQKTGCRNSGE